MGSFGCRNRLSTALLAAVLIIGCCSSLANALDNKVMCYVCDNCNSVGVLTKMESGTYCKKTVLIGETSRSAVDSCIAIPKVTYCCQNQLCNSASSIKQSLGVVTGLAAVAARLLLF